MMNIDLLDNRKSLIGTILNIERKERNKKLQDLASSGKTVQYISDIENGNKNLYEPTVKKLFDLIDIDFNFDQKIVDEVSTLFDDMMHAYLNLNRIKRKTYMEKITSHPVWEFSYAYPMIQLTKYMATVLHEIDFSYDIINWKCEKLFKVFTNQQKSIYLLMKAIHDYYQLGKLQSAKESLKQSISFSPEDAITGFTYNQLGNLVSLDFDLIKSLEYQRKGIEILKRHGYYQRSIYLELMIGNHLAELRRFNEMKDQYLRVYDFAMTFNIDELKYKSLYNLAYYSMYGKYYEDVIDYANKVLEIRKNTYECHYILAWSYLEMGRLSKANEHYQLLAKLNKHDDYIIDAYEKCIKYRLSSKDASYYKTLINLYKKLYNKFYTFDKVMVLEYIIEYCDHHELFEEGYGYQKELLKILQKNH